MNKNRCASWTKVKSNLWWNQYQRHNSKPCKAPDDVFPFTLLLLAPAQEIKCNLITVYLCLFMLYSVFPPNYTFMTSSVDHYSCHHQQQQEQEGEDY